MEYIIRCCEQKDLQSLVELCKSHSEYEKVYFNGEGKIDLLREAIFSSYPKLFCYVVESNNALVGYFTYTFDFSTWDCKTFLYLDCLFLNPDFRNLGIGEKVFDKLKKIASEHNCINIQWQTPSFNERAIKFYKRIGGFGKEKIRFFIEVKK